MLAYVGRIDAGYAAALAAQLAARARLDLSDIRLAAPAAAPPSPPPPPPKPAAAEVGVGVTARVLAAVAAQATGDAALQLAVARAAQRANRGLPPSTATVPSGDELFRAVLGLAGPSKAAAGPALEARVVGWPPPAAPRRAPDVIDVLAGARRRPAASAGVGLRVTVPAGDEGRGRVFLERVKRGLEEAACSA